MADAFPSRAEGGRSDVLPFSARETTLPNRLRVIVVPTGLPNLVSLQIPVQTGSRNEVEPGKSGFAHFFEHMMFRGTPRYPPAVYQEIMTRAGARQNAYTTDDFTNYHATFAAEDLETVLALEADRFMYLSYSEADFKTEARAVLGEYNKNAANPLLKLEEAQRERAFTVHPYRHTTMGFLADVEAMPEQFDYSRTFFARWYRPEYTTVLVAGDVDPEQTIALVEKYWGAWQPGAGEAIAIPQEPPPEGPVVAHVPWPSPTLPWVTIAFHAPAFSDAAPDFAALDLLLDLHFGETSDLYRRLVEVEQTVDRLLIDYGPAADPSLATIMARVKRPEDTPAVRDAILTTVEQARREPVAVQRLADAQRHNRYAFARTLDTSESVAATLARFVRFDRSYQTVNRLFRRYDALTPDDLLAAGRRYLTPQRLVQTTLAHEPLPVALERVPEPAPAAAPAPGATASGPAWLTLPSPSPLVRFKLAFGAGSAHDPAGREGLAAFSAAMVAEAGSEELPFDAITRALFPIAGSFTAQVDKELTVFTGVAHRDTLDRFADIALPQLLRPGMRPSDFERLRARQLNALVQDLRSNNDEELGKERLQANVFAGTPYGHPSLGTVAGIQSVTPDDVRAFMARAFTRTNLTVGLAGDVPAPFRERLERELRALPAGEPPALPAFAGRMPQGLEVEIIAKETPATAISFGYPIQVTRSHPDFVPLWLARAWLGEHRASNGRLYQRLRELRGLNYGDYAYIEAFPRGMYAMLPGGNVVRRAQLFEVWIRPVVPRNGMFAFKLALHELRRLIAEGLSEEDFTATRDYLLKNVFVQTASQDRLLAYALDNRWYGLGDFVTTMREWLARLTRDEVNAAVRRHLQGENLSAVFITRDAAGLRDELLADTDSTVVYDAAKPAEILAEDRTVGALRLGLQPEQVRITPVDEVFAE